MSHEPVPALFQTYETTIETIDKINKQYTDSEPVVASVLQYIRDRKFITSESIKQAIMHLSLMQNNAARIESENLPGIQEYLKDGTRLIHICQQINQQQILLQKSDTIIKMAYILFHDQNANTCYDTMRLKLKTLVMTGKDTENILKNTELLQQGLETTDQKIMVETFQTLAPVFNPAVLSNILVKNFDLKNTDKNLLFKGFTLNDTQFLQLVYDKEPKYETYFQPVVPVNLPVTETPKEPSSKSSEKEEQAEEPVRQEKPVETQPVKAKAKNDAIHIVEGRAKKAFDPLPDTDTQMPAGFFINDTLTQDENEHPAVTYAYSMLENPNGHKDAIDYIEKASEQDENLLFIEEQMKYAFGETETTPLNYSYKNFAEIFGNNSDNQDFFGAAVLTAAFMPEPVYEYDCTPIIELTEKKFSEQKFSGPIANAIKTIFYKTDKFKRNHKTGFLTAIAEKDTISSTQKQKNALSVKTQDFKQTVASAYQAKNPFLEIMGKIGFNEIYDLFDQFTNTDDNPAIHRAIYAFLTKNKLIKTNKTTGQTIPDDNGINDYKDAIWNKYGSSGELKKQYSNPSHLNEYGKSKQVNKLYHTAVEFLIQCMEYTETAKTYNMDDYNDAAAILPEIVNNLETLLESRYKAVSYMADRYIQLLKEK